MTYRTESGLFDYHLERLISTLERRVDEIERAGDYTDEDEMELSALERLIQALEAI